MEDERVGAGATWSAQALRCVRLGRSPRPRAPLPAAELDPMPCAGFAARRVQDVGGDGDAHAANLRACARCSRAMSASSARTRAPPAPRPLRRPPAGRRSAAPRGRDRRRILGSGELEDVRSPDCQVGALARLERSDVVASQHRRAASRSEAKRFPRGHRRGPPRPRATSSACLTSRTGRPARSTRSRRRRARRVHPLRPGALGWADAGSQTEVRRGQCGSRVRAQRSRPRRPRRRGRSARTTRPVPSQPRSVRYSTGVQPYSSRQYAPSSIVSARCVCRGRPKRRASDADSCMSRFVTENGEHGATAIGHGLQAPIHAAAPTSRSVSASTASSLLHQLVGGRPPSETPRSIEPRQATIRTPSSRAACTSASTSPVRRAGRRSDGRTPSCSPSASSARPRARRRTRLRRRPRPHRVELAQPAEEVRLLRSRAGEGLGQVVVRVDEPGRHDGVAELLGRVGLGLRARPTAATPSRPRPAPSRSRARSPRRRR